MGSRKDPERKDFCQVKALLYNGDAIWELVNVIHKYYPLEMEKYKFVENFTGTSGWKWAKIYKKYAQRNLKFLARVYAAKATAMGKKYKFKFGVQLLDNFSHSSLLEI